MDVAGDTRRPLSALLAYTELSASSPSSPAACGRQRVFFSSSLSYLVSAKSMGDTVRCAVVTVTPPCNGIGVLGNGLGLGSGMSWSRRKGARAIRVEVLKARGLASRHFVQPVLVLLQLCTNKSLRLIDAFRRVPRSCDIYGERKLGQDEHEIPSPMWRAFPAHHILSPPSPSRTPVDSPRCFLRAFSK